MEANKGFLHALIKAVVHGEAFGFPVHRVAETAHLLGDGAAGFFFPFPDFFNKFFPAHLFAARLAFSGELALNNHLRGDTGVIGAHLPEGVLALHAIVASQGIHDAVLQGVADMQAAGDIGWWNNNAVGLACVAAAAHIGGKIAAFFPGFIPFGFYFLGGKCFFHYRARLSGFGAEN